MKAIMVMFDSLNRRMLPPYGNNWVHASNFKRLSEKSVVFDNCYAGSLPCMPARRELHTGRYNFLHRSWGPIEPFDDSMPEILKRNGVYTHLVSDHYHYWEDGGCTYHTRYNTWEICRGQEGDPWKGEVKDPLIPEHVPSMREGTNPWRQDWINRKYMGKEEDMPQAQTFRLGMAFIRKNHQEDRWFLQIETFDPHEPYFSPQPYKDLYPDTYKGHHFDWPNYDLVSETPEQVDHCRYENAALVSMCDAYLGKIMDLMDEHDLWKDTMLIVNTDHGFLLGEHGWWAKMVQPVYNEIAHTPLFIWDPRSSRKKERRKALVQTIDLAPTLLEYFGVPVPETMEGCPLANAIDTDAPVREAGLFGVHGSHVNVTDGRYVYMRGPVQIMNQPLYEYTLMPTHMARLFSVQELQNIALNDPFSFTKGCKTMRIQSHAGVNPYIFGSLLFDLENDPHQENPLKDDEIERRMVALMIDLMKKNDAPQEQFERLGLPQDGNIGEKHLVLRKIPVAGGDRIGNTDVRFINKGRLMFYALISAFPEPMRMPMVEAFEREIQSRVIHEISSKQVIDVMMDLLPERQKATVMWLARIVNEKGKE